VNSGYVISGIDLGHVGGDGTPGVNVDGTYLNRPTPTFLAETMTMMATGSKPVTGTDRTSEE